MKIVHLSLQPRDASAGTTHTAELVRALRRHGCAVEIVSVSGGGGLARRLVRTIAVQIRAVRLLMAADLIYARMHPLAAVTVSWARLLRRRVVVEVNGVADDYLVVYPALQRVKWLLRAALRRQLHDADDVVVVTAGLAVWVRAFAEPRGRVIVVPNAADPERFRPGLPRPADAPDDYVLFFGALSPWQGLDAALAAVDHPDWPAGVSLAVIGDGVLRDVVERAARRCRNVRYLGPRPFEEVPAYVSNAVATLALKEYHDDRSGQSPLKVYESLACGVPVVTTDLHGVGDVVAEHDAGVVLAHTDAGAVAAAVARLRGDADRRADMGERGRAAVLDGHTWARRAEAVLDIVGRGDWINASTDAGGQRRRPL